MKVRGMDADLWEKLLRTRPEEWLRVLQRWGIDPEFDDNPETDDDPVPEAAIKVLDDLDTGDVFEMLKAIPRHKSKYFNDRIRQARRALTGELKTLWQEGIRRLGLRLPLLVLDEAHHLKNAKTRLASLFHVDEAREDADEVTRGALGGVFERMLFLTATPFQLGHGELCSVLSRFEGVRWKGKHAPVCTRKEYRHTLEDLRQRLDKAQEAAIALDNSWGLLQRTDLVVQDRGFLDVSRWWEALDGGDGLSSQAQSVLACYKRAHRAMREAEEALQPWVIRHLRPRNLPEHHGHKERRLRMVGRAILDDASGEHRPGLPVGGQALLPFLLAARATACTPASRPVFAEGLASSYEAFTQTRRRLAEADGLEDTTDTDDDSTEHDGVDAVGRWYLDRLQELLPRDNADASAAHPKVSATIRRVLDLWGRGEKVVVFCHYVSTGRALRRRLSEAIASEIDRMAAQKLGCSPKEARDELTRLGERFFDEDSAVRRVCDEQVGRLLRGHPQLEPYRDKLLQSARRYLRTPSFLVRYMPLEGGKLDRPAVTDAFERCDDSRLCLREVLDHFFGFLAARCGPEERRRYIEEVGRTQTGSHVGGEAAGSFAEDELQGDQGTLLLPNVRLVNGDTRQETRQRLMLTFNTPFYPEVLIASSVMAEGVDLHLNCRFVIHHDLCWNPSTLEQRTGRIDRIGAKAERCGEPIHVYLPFVAETQDEKMYRVVMDRERWFSVVMGQEFKLDARTTDRLADRIPFPASAASELAFALAVC